MDRSVQSLATQVDVLRFGDMPQAKIVAYLSLLLASRNLPVKNTFLSITSSSNLSDFEWGEPLAPCLVPLKRPPALLAPAPIPRLPVTKNSTSHHSHIIY